jgi:hypothetical protein
MAGTGVYLGNPDSNSSRPEKELTRTDVIEATEWSETRKSTLRKPRKSPGTAKLMIWRRPF